MKHSFLMLFAMCLALGSCKKDSGGDDPATSTAEFFFQGKIDGKAVLIELLPTNDIELSTSNSGSIGPPDCSFGYGAYIAPIDPEKKPQAEVHFSQYFSGDCADEGTVFNTLFPVGNQVFLDAAIGGKGVEMHWIDDSGNYSSAKGPQTTGQFKITKSEVANDAFGLGQSISGTVSCTMYDDSGAKKELTNGVFRLHFRAYF